MHYNPFTYINNEKDILKLVTALMANTRGRQERRGVLLLFGCRGQAADIEEYEKLRRNYGLYRHPARPSLGLS